MASKSSTSPQNFDVSSDVIGGNEATNCLVFGSDWFDLIAHYDWLVFDFDGTLVETDLCKRAAVRNYIRNVVPDCSEINVGDMTRADIYTELVSRCGYWLDEERFQSGLKQALKQMYSHVPFPLAHKKLLQKVWGRSVIVTAGAADEISVALAQCELSEIEIVETGLDKTEALSNLKRTRLGTMIFIGNTDWDEVSALNVGMDFFRVVQ